MYLTINKSRRNSRTHPDYHRRTEELAKMLVNSMGYDQALEKAQESRWESVADTIRFMASQTLRRF